MAVGNHVQEPAITSTKLLLLCGPSPRRTHYALIMPVRLSVCPPVCIQEEKLEESYVSSVAGVTIVTREAKLTENINTS